MRLSELQNKDIVDINTGEKIGNISDMEVNLENGLITKIFIYNKKRVFNVLRGNEEDYFLCNQIKKIGKDVILIDKNIK